MNILEAITGAQNGAAVDQLASQFGLKPDQASSAIGALVPALAAGLKHNTSTDSGLSGLLGALAGGRHEAYLDNPGKLAEPATTADGNAILGHLLGSKDVSRQVAARASQQTGIDTGILKKMLPLVATMVMAGLSKRSGAASGGIRDPQAARGGITSMLEPMLDRDRDGSMVDDVAGMLGGLLGRKR